MSIKVCFKHQFPNQLIDIDMEIPEKGVTAIFGRSGCGKSTVLNSISGLLSPDSGEISTPQQTLYSSEQKRNVAVWQRQIGFVFQDSRLFPHMTARQNIIYGQGDKLNNEKLNALLRMLDLEALLEAMPHRMSGGEKQRVAIARALLSEPDLLLMDEPLASLDLPRKREIIQYLRQLSNIIETPIVYVTHSLEEVMHLADHIVVLDDGRVTDSGTVEAVWNGHALSLWQEGEQQSTLLNVTVDDKHPQYAMRKMRLENNVIWVPDVGLADKLGEVVRMRINAQDVSVTLSPNLQGSIRNVVETQIESISVLNAHSYLLELTLSGDIKLKSSITRWAADELGLKVGQIVFAQVKGVSFTQQKLAIH